MSLEESTSRPPVASSERERPVVAEATLRLDQDMHVRSTFSNGRHGPKAVVASARRRGIRCLGFGDRVRRDSQWLPEYVQQLRDLRSRSDIDIVIGVEGKLLDAVGTLELPPDMDGIERILMSDHRLPVDGELLVPRQVRERLAAGCLVPRQVIDALLSAYEGCIMRYPNLQLARPLSFLSRVEIPEWQIPLVQLRRLALIAARRGTIVTVSERWRCPSPAVARILSRAGVPLVAATDARDAREVACYRYVRSIGCRVR